MLFTLPVEKNPQSKRYLTSLHLAQVHPQQLINLGKSYWFSTFRKQQGEFL